MCCAGNDIQKANLLAGRQVFILQVMQMFGLAICRPRRRLAFHQFIRLSLAQTIAIRHRSARQPENLGLPERLYYWKWADRLSVWAGMDIRQALVPEGQK